MTRQQWAIAWSGLASGCALAVALGDVLAAFYLRGAAMVVVGLVQWSTTRHLWEAYARETELQREAAKLADAQLTMLYNLINRDDESGRVEVGDRGR